LGGGARYGARYAALAGQLFSLSRISSLSHTIGACQRPRRCCTTTTAHRFVCCNIASSSILASAGDVGCALDCADSAPPFHRHWSACCITPPLLCNNNIRSVLCVCASGHALHSGVGVVLRNAVLQPGMRSYAAPLSLSPRVDKSSTDTTPDAAAACASPTPAHGLSLALSDHNTYTLHTRTPHVPSVVCYMRVCVCVRV
jgi:hypothetical protein